MTKLNFSQLSPYLLAATATLMSLWLFILVKVDIRRAARKRAEDRKDILEACRKIQETIDEMRRQPPPVPLPAAQLEPLPAGPASSMSRRAQVLRMARRGDRPDQIAAALGVPVNEVALVLKVASLQQASAASA